MPASPHESISGRAGDAATIASSTPAQGDVIQEKSADDVEAPSPPAAGQFTPPDGGLQAWLVVAGAWLMMFSTFGYVNAFGVYEAYYVQHLPEGASAISWIGSFQLWLQLALGFATGRIFDAGYGRVLLLAGSAIYALSLFMTSLCTTYWQIFLAQGVAGGLGLGITFLPTIGIIAHWFKRRRAFATGIAVSGSSVGGICFPIMLNKLFASVGFAKGVRASAYLVLGCLAIANLLLKPRIPGRKHRPADMQFPPADMKAILRHKAYWFTIAGTALIMWGIFTPIFFLQVYAESHGISTSLAFYSLSILNAASVFGRTIPNFLADKVGVFNMFIGAAAVSGGLVFVWLAAGSPAGLICFALCYGFFSGAFISLTPGCFAALSSHMGEIGVRMGFAWGVISLAALTGTPISGALLGTDEYVWWRPAVFSGVAVLAGVCVTLVARRLQARTMGTWKV